MSTKPQNSKATTKQQYQIMLDFMKANGDLSASRAGRTQTTLLWCQLTEKLNKCPDGSPKHYKNWVKVWSDWKTRVKKKAQTMQFDESQTSALTLTECQLMVFMGFNIDVKDGTAELNMKPLLHHNPEEVEEITVKPKICQRGTYAMENVDVEYLHGSDADQEEEIYTNYEALEPSDGEMNTIDKPPPAKKRRKIQHKIKTNPHPASVQRSNTSQGSIIDKFAALESRRIELELLREQNESRRISAQIQSNANQQQFTEFMQFMKGAVTSFLTTYRSKTLSNGES